MRTVMRMMMRRVRGMGRRVGRDNTRMTMRMRKTMRTIRSRTISRSSVRKVTATTRKRRYGEEDGDRALPRAAQAQALRATAGSPPAGPPRGAAGARGAAMEVLPFVPQTTEGFAG